MIYFIIGHRGVGKTHWLIKLKKLFTAQKIKAAFLDLDKEIEKHTKKNIKDLWNPHFINPDKNFRKIELKVLNTLIKKHKDQVFIALGAGFDLKKLKKPKTSRIIYLQRETDSNGRIFLNRPRLKPHLSPYQEYLRLYKTREKIYQKYADEHFVLPEGDFNFNALEKLFFNINLDVKNTFIQQKKLAPEVLTLNKNILPKDSARWPSFINRRIKWGLKYFEVRDADWTDKKLEKLLPLIPLKKLLLSFRRKTASQVFLRQNVSKILFDWPLEKNHSFKPGRQILSLHKRKGKTVKDFKKILKTFNIKPPNLLKLAVEVYSLEELLLGHKWFLKDPKHRIFLPTSPKKNNLPGNWRWYRKIFGPNMPFYFIRESKTGLKDQPYLYENVKQLKSMKTEQKLFFAVLGFPIKHSASPSYYRKWADKNNLDFVKINIPLESFTKKNLNILKSLGLRGLAVTSPLKKKAFNLCLKKYPCALKAKAVNTMVFQNNMWAGFNTDIYALTILLKKLNKESTAVWGGGGLLAVLKQILPKAQFYSARTGRLRTKTPNLETIKIVVWAVGRNKMSFCKFPDLRPVPKKVLDLNYTEDSPGKEYALMMKAKYESGWDFFKIQADKQKIIFNQYKN